MTFASGSIFCYCFFTSTIPSSPTITSSSTVFSLREISPLPPQKKEKKGGGNKRGGIKEGEEKKKKHVKR
jgi:hypothetical protein